MILRARIELKRGEPITTLEKWIAACREEGFTDRAIVKIGKTTGQKYVLLIHEQRNESPHDLPAGWEDPKPDRPKPKMWPEV